MEERYFFPAAVKALKPQDWAEIAARLTDRTDPSFSSVVEEKFEIVRRHILQLEQEAEAERSAHCCRSILTVNQPAQPAATRSRSRRVR